MKKIKITRDGNVNCPTRNKFVNITQCKECDFCFGVVSYSHVNCRRGIKQDEYISRKKEM